MPTPDSRSQWRSWIGCPMTDACMSCLTGVLVVSPRPTTIYQFAAFQLGKVLDAACPEDLCVMPVTITPAHLTSRLRPRGSEAG